MSITITKDNVDTFIKRASVFTTGGGLSIREQLKSLKPIRSKLNVSVLHPDELSDSSVVCSVSELGDIKAPPLEKAQLLPHMLQDFENVIGKKIDSLFPPEVGQESIVLESAHYAHLPIVDFDPVGFRAVPFVDVNIALMDNPKKSFTPAVIATDRGEVFVIQTPATYQRSEEMLRNMTLLSEHGCVLILGELTAMKEIKRLSRKAVSSYHVIMQEEFSTFKNAILQFRCTVIRFQEFEYTGFTCKTVQLEDLDSGDTYYLGILNEALLLFNNKKELIASVPERILLLSESDEEGISSEALLPDTIFRVAVLPPELVWDSKKGRELFGAHRFEFFRKYLDED